MTVILDLQKVSISLQEKTIVSDLDLQLNEGDILGLVGASGCGKTTLLNAIAGFNTLSHGSIILENRTLSDSDKIVPAEQRQVGMIFQDYALFPHLSVKENVAFGLKDLCKENRDSQVEKLLSLLKLTEHSERYIHQLSGGQQQRVAIARALAPKPKLLLLDEPFSNIDARLRNELMIEIRQLLKQFKTTAIFVTHNKDEVFTFADKMAVMANGKLLQLDSPSYICQHPNSYQVADFLQLGSWVPCKLNSNIAHSLLGDFEVEKLQCFDEDYLNILVKPSQLVLEEYDENVLPNAQVDYISMTEQGFHYSLSAIANATLDNERTDSLLLFSKLSIYSDKALSLQQKVSVTIKKHNYLLFKKG